MNKYCVNCLVFDPYNDPYDDPKNILSIDKSPDNCSKWLCNYGGCPFDSQIKQDMESHEN